MTLLKNPVVNNHYVTVDGFNLLKCLKLDFTLLDLECCDMAGAFVFEKKHYEKSYHLVEVLQMTLRQTNSNQSL